MIVNENTQTNSEGRAPSLDYAVAKQPERDVHAASVYERNGGFASDSTRPAIYTVKRRERRAPLRCRGITPQLFENLRQ